jgi:hypothetical protein
MLLVYDVSHSSPEEIDCRMDFNLQTLLPSGSASPVRSTPFRECQRNGHDVCHHYIHRQPLSMCFYLNYSSHFLITVCPGSSSLFSNSTQTEPEESPWHCLLLYPLSNFLSSTAVCKHLTASIKPFNFIARIAPC